jgi:hypothetical protein
VDAIVLPGKKLKAAKQDLDIAILVKGACRTDDLGLLRKAQTLSAFVSIPWVEEIGPDTVFDHRDIPFGTVMLKDSIRQPPAEGGYAFGTPNRLFEQRENAGQSSSGKGFEIVVQVNDAFCSAEPCQQNSEDGMEYIGACPDKIRPEVADQSRGLRKIAGQSWQEQLT